MKCCLCDNAFYRDKESIFSRKPPICKKCGNSLVERLFVSDEFNRWLDSFMQSRIQKYIPAYTEYYKRYNLKKCPDCQGTGLINTELCDTYSGDMLIHTDTKICKTCQWIGTIEE